MKRDYPRERVSLIHESGDYVAEAQYAFQHFGNCEGQFVTLEPRNWQKAPALQVADFIAYEIMKTSHKRLEGEDAVRKTLQAMMGKKIPGAFAYLPRGGFRELKAMMEQDQRRRKRSQKSARCR